VDVGLDLLEVGETVGAAQAAGTALLVVVFFEAVVDREQVLVYTVSALIWRHARARSTSGRTLLRQAELGRVSPGDRVLLVVENLEPGERSEDFLLNDRCVDVFDFDQAGR
jgi:hypothetical protein